MAFLAAMMLIDDGKLPTIGIKMTDVKASEIAGLREEYQAAWKKLAYEKR